MVWTDFCKNKQFSFVKLLAVYCWFHSIYLLACKPPPLSINTHYYPSRKIYNPGDKVRYQCNSSSLSVYTNSFSECLKTGNWSLAKLPQCRKCNMFFYFVILVTRCRNIIFVFILSHKAACFK